MFAALKGWTSAQKHVVAASYLGWTLDAFDFFLMVFVIKDVAKEFGVGKDDVAVAIMLTLAFRAIGAFVFGRLADRFGRRPILMLSVGLYSLFGFATAFAPNLFIFLTVRALFGIAMGGEWGIGASLTMESVKTEARGFVSGLLQSGYPTGYLLASIVYRNFYDVLHWRGMFLVGILPALLVLYIRRHVPESPGWRAPQKPAAASASADSAMVYIPFALAGTAIAILSYPYLGPWGFALGAAPVVLGIAYLRSPLLRTHWRLALYAILLMTAFNFFSHGTQDVYPTFLQVQHKFDTHTAGNIAIVYNIGAILGGWVFGLWSQSLGRRRAMIVAALASIPATYFWAYSDTAVMLAVGAFAMQFFVQGAWGVVPAHLNELAPADARGTFPGTVYQLGNFIASYNAVLQTRIAIHNGENYSLALAGVAVAAALAIVLLAALGPEARQADLGAQVPASS